MTLTLDAAPDLATRFPLLVEDEYAVLAALAPLAGQRILDIGCGAGASTERMAQEGAREVLGLEVDERQLAKNLARKWPAAVRFEGAGAEALPVPDADANSGFDLATLFKSLHHIPIPLMDAAFDELARALRPGGRVYIAEPVYDGPYNDVMKLFHDEGRVRAAALDALERAIAGGRFRPVRHLRYFTQVRYADFADFHKRQMMPTHSELRIDEALASEVRQVFETHLSPRGAFFTRPMRVDLLERV